MDFSKYQTVIEIVTGADFHESRRVSEEVSVHIQNGWVLLAIHERGWKGETEQMTTVYVLGHQNSAPIRFKQNRDTKQWEPNQMLPVKPNLPEIPF